jgi:hypothetical protein
MRDITYPQAIEIALQSKEPNNTHVASVGGDILLQGNVPRSRPDIQARLAGLRETLRRQ